MEDLLSIFFNKSFENEINDKLQELNYAFEKEKVIDYCKKIISIDIKQFFIWIDNHKFFTISSVDLPQLSDFNDAFYNVVYLLKENGDFGFRYVEIGKLLQNDSIERNDMANRKYGENHAKAAEYLGYLYSLQYYYYVSCIGYILDDLNVIEKKKLFTRLLIRTNLFKAIYVMTKNNVLDFKKLFEGVVSEKTYKRRLSGTRLILNKLNDSHEFNFTKILNKINY
jgi:hypothetical protein